MAIHQPRTLRSEEIRKDLKAGPISQRWWYRLFFAWWK
jgi:hypothetical protein